MSDTRKNDTKLDNWDNLNIYLSMGPPTFEKVMEKYNWCHTMRIVIAYTSRVCKHNFNPLPTPAFNPLPWQHTSALLFGSKSEVGNTFESLTGRATYGIHAGNAFTKKFRILLKSDSVIAGVVKRVCPVTTELLVDEM
jgi:hypothetical protein